MKFGAANWLIALPILIGSLAALWMWSAGRARRTLKRAFNTPLLTRLVSSVDPKRRWLKKVLFAFGISALAVALARPQWGRSEIKVERAGVDLMIAVDVSRSMLAADAGTTNRLAVATKAVERLLSELEGDRVGLILFAGEAFVSAPLTRDHVAVERALGSAGPAMISEQGSNLAEAIKRAEESFERGTPGARALLVVSDGEQLQGDADEAARRALKGGITIHTAGVGSATGTRVPIRTGAAPMFLRNALGREVYSRRDEERLQRIAWAGGGIYTRIDETDSRALADWFRRASARLPRCTEKRMLNEPGERFQWPLALAVLILASEWLLGDRRSPAPQVRERAL